MCIYVTVTLYIDNNMVSCQVQPVVSVSPVGEARAATVTALLGSPDAPQTPTD